MPDYTTVESDPILIISMIRQKTQHNEEKAIIKWSSWTEIC